MKVREINLFKRFKNKNNIDLEYLILNGNEIVDVSSDLNALADNISKISKKYSINKIMYNQKVPEKCNGDYFYMTLSREETKELDKYLDNIDIFS